MDKYLNKYLQEREKMNEQYRAPKYRKLKFAAISVLAVGIIILLCIAFEMENITPKAMLIMQGCAGLCAIAFVVLATILTYSANKGHINNRRNNRCL